MKLQGVVMKRFWVMSVLCALGVSVQAQGETCDRSCLKALVNQVLDSMGKHDTTVLPMATTYRLTVGNAPSGLSMATPWRTVSSYRQPVQYVVDTPRQEVFFIATVIEGNLPSLLFGRLKAADRKLTEIELYMGRSKADSGMQFDPEGLANLPKAWTTPVPQALRPSRAELERVALADFDPSLQTLDVDGNCELVENGKRVVARVNLESFLKEAPAISKETIERIKAAKGGEMPIGCDRVDPPTDKKERVLVDEEDGVTVTLVTVPGMVFANFMPPPGPNPEFPTVFVPNSMGNDQAGRMEAVKHLPGKLEGPVALPMPGVLAGAEVTKFYGNRIQGTHRLFQEVPVGSRSPWVPE
jgi:hypothetical protein